MHSFAFVQKHDVIRVHSTDKV